MGTLSHDFKPKVGEMFLTTSTLYTRTVMNDSESVVAVNRNTIFMVIDNSHAIWSKIIESSGRCSYLYHTWWQKCNGMRIV